MALCLTFFIWGVAPAYWKLLETIPSFEIILHRMVWSLFFLLPFFWREKQRAEFMSICTQPKTMGSLLITTSLLSVNWFIYVWAINHKHILEASMGYYINPLVNVLLGMIFLKERLSRLQVLSVLFAFAGVLNLSISYGVLPWIALSLALTFGFYGLIRKVITVQPVTGLTIETAIVCLPAIAILVYLSANGSGGFQVSAPGMGVLLMGTGLVTAVPLVLFTVGARRVHLTTVGFLQYLAPSISFLLAIFVYGEPFTRPMLVTFILIWVALIIYSMDSILVYRSAGIHGDKQSG